MIINPEKKIVTFPGKEEGDGDKVKFAVLTICCIVCVAFSCAIDIGFDEILTSKWGGPGNPYLLENRPVSNFLWSLHKNQLNLPILPILIAAILIVTWFSQRRRQKEETLWIFRVSLALNMIVICAFGLYPFRLALRQLI
jgi:cytochrome bd-type quinol oxidase subunit 2